jgi:predicted NBD/HSP70 family sugar kinase
MLKDTTQNFQSMEWSRDKKLINVVIALPGIVDSVNGVSAYSPHYPDWGEKWNFRDDFLKATDLDVPVYLDCVNRYQAFAEKEKGAAIGVDNFLIIDAMDEGVGAGVIINGTIRHGSQNLSGEIGHMILDHRGPECICGGKGCFEALVSVKNLHHILSEGNPAHKESLVYREHEDYEVGVNDLFQAACEGDNFAVEVLDRIAYWFAIGLNNVIMVNDPSLIIIQGIYTRAGSQFLKNLKNKIDHMSFPILSRNVELVYSAFGPDRGVLGAGCFGVWSYFQSKELYKQIDL